VQKEPIGKLKNQAQLAMDEGIQQDLVLTARRMIRQVLDEESAQIERRQDVKVEGSMARLREE
jgi:hypothetical protein